MPMTSYKKLRLSLTLRKVILVSYFVLQPTF